MNDDRIHAEMKGFFGILSASFIVNFVAFAKSLALPNLSLHLTSRLNPAPRPLPDSTIHMAGLWLRLCMILES